MLTGLVAVITIVHQIVYKVVFTNISPKSHYITITSGMIDTECRWKQGARDCYRDSQDCSWEEATANGSGLGASTTRYGR